eukprot:455091-Rhodomonas_salina.1
MCAAIRARSPALTQHALCNRRIRTTIHSSSAWGGRERAGWKRDVDLDVQLGADGGASRQQGHHVVSAEKGRGGAKGQAEGAAGPEGAAAGEGDG